MPPRYASALYRLLAYPVTWLLLLPLLPPLAFGQVEVDMAGVAAESEGWTLQLSDNFDRADLGPNWKGVRGVWTVGDGMLRGGEAAHIVSTWRFTGDVRLEYEAVTDAEDPCDLSGAISAKWGEESSGYYFGFGGQHNRDSFLIVRNDVVARAPMTIVPGRRYTVVCQREGKKITFAIDGKVIMPHVHDRPVALPEHDRVGLSVWAPGRFDHVRIHVGDETRIITSVPEHVLMRIDDAHGAGHLVCHHSVR